MAYLGSNHRPTSEGALATLEPPRSARIQDPFLALSTAELAECTCPEFCERDHDTD